MTDQPQLFDEAPPAPGLPPRQALVRFLSAMLAVWFCHGRPTREQAAELERIARDTIGRAQNVNPEGAPT